MSGDWDLIGGPSGRVVVVTGASAGVGRAIVREYARRGDRVAIIARGAAGIEAARRECLAIGAPQALAIECDVSDADAVAAAAALVEAELGPIDIWVNNAMTSVFAAAWDITPEEYRRVLGVNFLGVVHGTLAALTYMRPRGRGGIVQIGSTLAYRGIPLQAPYSASKHAVQGFCDSLYAELRRDHPGIRITMVQLPAMNTPQFSWVRTRLPRHPQPVPPIFQPELAARAVVYAGDTLPRELNVTGRTPVIRALNALMPGVLEWYMARGAGFDGQQAEQRIDAETWEDNLDKPLDAFVDRGARGVFDDRARTFAPSVWLRMHRGTVGAVTAGVLGAAAATLAVTRRR